MICYIIIGHMGNKIQILLDIDDFFSILFKKTQIFYLKKKLFERTRSRKIAKQFSDGAGVSL
jgi:hypothetical protein